MPGVFDFSNFLSVFFWKFSTKPQSSPGELQKMLELIMQQSHSNIVVKVVTKNKGLTFKCGLNAVNFIFSRRFVHTWSALLELQEQNTQVFLVSFMEQ